MEKRAASPVSPPQEEKPPDWRECYDANYKRTYFFNVASGESRWRAPDDRYVPYEKPIEGPVRAQSVDPAALKMAAGTGQTVAVRERDALRGRATARF